MLELSGELLDPEDAQLFELKCIAIDAVEVESAYQNTATELPRCRFPVAAMLMVRLGVDADMVMPLPVCAIHGNAFNMSLHEGIMIDLDFFYKEK